MRFQKGHKGFWKGRKHSEETKRKISITLIGQKRTEETKRKISVARLKDGLKPSHKNCHHSQKTKQKLREIHKGHHYSKRTEFKEGRIGAKGENSPGWKGGITPLRTRIYNSQQYKLWRQQVFIRDNFTCQDCGERGGHIEVHHCKKSFSQLLQEVRENLPLIDLYEAVMIYTPFWDLDNGETLCKRCHKKTKNYAGRGSKR